MLNGSIADKPPEVRALQPLRVGDVLTDFEGEAIRLEVASVTRVGAVVKVFSPKGAYNTSDFDRATFPKGLAVIRDGKTVLAKWPPSDVIPIFGCELYMSCSACPEQYEVYKDGRQIGYLRVRWGHFYARYPDECGVTVYEDDIKGYGDFWDTEERAFYLTAAVRALLERAA